ncbi:MAG: hypothetical protein M0R80_01530 [Proteobacteria bacterium]|jgi:calcineurin-like phosphoesterase family protein|nr:hypothetical protein [Pseudomonadota bacterium]
MDYFTADTHFGHGNILKYCHRLQFMTDSERAVMASGDHKAISQLRISQESISRMDRGMLDHINSVVGEKDRLIHVGDFCWVRGDPHRIAGAFIYYRKQIKCRNVVLVWGNHDPKQFSAGREAIDASGYFRTHADMLSLRIGDKNYVASHYAYAIWDRRHHGARNLYGHSHARAEAWLDSIMPGRFSMDVGIDNAFKLLGEYRPFSLDEIESIMSTRSGFGLLRKGEDDERG